MKRINKITTLILITVLTLMTVTLKSNIFAVTGSINAGGNRTILVGESLDIPVSFSSDESDATFSATATKSGSSIAMSGTTNFVLDAPGRGGSISVTGISEGTSTIYISGQTVSTNPPDFAAKAISTSINITVKNKSTGGGTPPPTPGTGGNNGNNGGSTKPSTPKPETSTPNKELTEEEKQAQAEAEKKAQLEAEQKVPLVDGIKITSRSPKMEGVALETLGTEEGTFSYSYELPKNIDRVELEMIPSKDGVELTYDKEVDFAADETSKTITANAKLGEISQDYEVVLTRTIPVVNKTEIDGKSITVLDDETLDSNMSNLGFEREEYEIEGGMGYFFVNGDIKLQLFVDKENNGSWYLLDEDNKPTEEAILLESGTEYALVLNAPEEMQKETLNTEKYSEKTIDFESRYTEVMTNLVMNNKYNAWTAEEGEVFYGILNGGEKRLLYKTKNDEGLVFEKAFVGFDHTNGTSKTVAIVSTATLGIAVVAGAVYTVMLKRKK